MNGLLSLAAKDGRPRDIVVLTCIALFFGLFGGPVYGHPTAVMVHGLRALVSRGNPHFFYYPGLIIYINAFVYGVTFVAMRAFGAVGSPAEFAARYYTGSLTADPAGVSFFLPGYVVTVVFLVAGVVATYLAAYELTRKRSAGLLAGLFTTTAFLWATHTHYPTVDVPLAALSIITAALALVWTRDRRRPDLWQVIVLGAMVGLTASAKYNGAAIILVVVPLMAFCYGGDWRALLRDLIVLGVTSVVAFLVCNPYVILAWHEFARYQANQMRWARYGYFTMVAKYDNPWGFHLRESLYRGYGAVPLVLAAIGMLWLGAARSIDLPRKLVMLGFPAAFFAVMGTSHQAHQRYVLPVIPFLGVWSALGLVAVGRGLAAKMGVANSRARRAAFLGAAVVVVAGSLAEGAYYSAYHGMLLSREDTRAQLRRVLADARLEAPLRVYSDNYARRSVIGSGLPTTKLWPAIGAVLRDHYKCAPCDSSDLMIFASYDLDRYIFDIGDLAPEGAALVRARLLAFCDHIGELTVVRISPYRAPRELVPYVYAAVYGPWVPEMMWRTRPGPYVEMYCKAEIAQHIAAACRRGGVRYLIGPAGRGYYARMLFAPNAPRVPAPIAGR